MVETTQSDVLIVGAGMAGMMAGHQLVAAGMSVHIVDKGYYPGGRMASKSLGAGLADIGAQFFTARDRAFQQWVDRWLEDERVFEWSRGWSDGSLGSVPPDGHPRYAVLGGMRELAQHLAVGLNITTSARLVRIANEDGRWIAHDERANQFIAQAVVLTPPVPQSLLLLDAGEIPISADDLETLESITYDPCLAGLFWVNGTVRLPDPGAVQRPNATITWLADNQRKGLSPDVTLITVHAGPAYSHQLWHMPDWEVMIALEGGLRLFKDLSTEIVSATLHRWRYATPAVTHEDRFMRAEGLPRLIFAGDAFGGPRIEGAALSGIAAGKALAEEM